MATNTEQVDLIVKAITQGFDKVAKDFGQMNTAVEQAGKASQQSGTRFTEMASKLQVAQQAFGMTAAAAGQVWGILEEGSALNLAKDRFDNLTASIGTTSDAMLNELGAATGGMMSNADMIASASQIISLGLADNQKDVVDLAALVSNLGWDMQQVIMTFANNSKMRLDALGLSVTDVEERAKALEAQGYSTDKAFDLAVIQAGQAKLELLGSAADTGAGAMKRLTVEWENMTTNAKGFIALRSEGAILGLAETIDAVSDANERGHSTARNFAVILNELSKTMGGVPGDALIDKIWGAEEAMVRAAEAASVYDANLQNVVNASYAAEQAQAMHLEELLNVDSELRVNMEAASAAAFANSELADKVGLLAGHMSESEAMIAAANVAIRDQGAAVDYSNVTWEKLINQLFIFDTEPIVKEMYDGERSARDFGTAVEGLATRLGALPSEVFVKIRVTREGDSIPGEGGYDGGMGGGGQENKPGESDKLPPSPPPPPRSGVQSVGGMSSGGGANITINVYGAMAASPQAIAGAVAKAVTPRG